MHIAQQYISLQQEVPSTLYTSHPQQEVLYTSHSSKILSEGDTVHIAQQYISLQQEVPSTLYTSHPPQEVLYTSHSSKILSEGDTVHIAQQYISLQQEVPSKLCTSHPRSRRYFTPLTAVKFSQKEIPYTLHSSTYPYSRRYLVHCTHHILAAGGTVYLAQQ